MNQWRTGTGILLACLFAATEARAGDTGTGISTGVQSDFKPPHRFVALDGRLAQSGGTFAGGITPGGITGSGMIGTLNGGNPVGFGGMCGAIGFTGMGGCCGGFSMIGMCGFNGCIGGYCPYGFGPMYGLGARPWLNQTYSKWRPSANKAYYYRVLNILTPSPEEMSFEFVLVHYPDRPKFFYYYDPVEKKYVGRYRLRARPDDCFSIIQPPHRKANLKDIPDPAYRYSGGMPPVSHLIDPKLAARPDLAPLKTLKLLRPPESIPDELLGLPAEEPTLKKGPGKR